MSQHSGSSSADSDEVEEQFLALIGESLEEPPSPPPTAATITTTNEGPVLASERTAADNFKTMAAAIEVQTEALRHLLQDAQGKVCGEENPTTSAAPMSPEQSQLVDRLRAEVEQLKSALSVARADLAAANGRITSLRIAVKAANLIQNDPDRAHQLAAYLQIREQRLIQDQIPNVFEAKMTELVEAVNTKWEDYNKLAAVVDPAKVIEDLRRRNEQLEEENKSLDRTGFVPKRMRDLVSKIKALRQRNSELKEKLKESEEAKADLEKITQLEAKLAKITRDKADLFSKQKTIFHLCKELKESQGHKGDLPEYKMNDMIFNMFEEFIRHKISGCK